jgi:hypothetical protein
MAQEFIERHLKTVVMREVYNDPAPSLVVMEDTLDGRSGECVNPREHVQQERAMTLVRPHDNDPTGPGRE